MLQGFLLLAMLPATRAQTCDGVPTHEARTDAVRRGLDFVTGYFLADPAHLEAFGMDGVTLYNELAETAADPLVRERSREMAQRVARTQAERFPADGLSRSYDDLMDALELVAVLPSLDVDADPVVAHLQRSLRLQSGVQSLCGGRPDKLEQLDDDGRYDLLMCGWASMRAHEAHPELKDLGAIEDTSEALMARWRSLDPTQAGEADRYLATHHALVLNDFGRKALSRSEALPLLSWLAASYPPVYAADDVELIGEYLDAFRTAGHDESTDSGFLAGTCKLLALQQDDGSWPPWEPDDHPYDVVHPTWAALAGLLERRAPAP